MYKDYDIQRVDTILERIFDNLDSFNDLFEELEGLAIEYGLTLSQLQKIINEIVNTNSILKINHKSKLISILYCNELIDFDTILKIICCFKIPTYYNKKLKIKYLHQNLQIKLSNFLVINFANIKLDKRYLQILSLIFDTLHIGYLRYNMGLFLIYLLNLTFEMDPYYNKNYFFNYKKLNMVLEFYEFNPKTSLHLLLYFADHLKNVPKSDLFHMLYLKYTMILENVKIPNNTFGKLQSKHVYILTTMREGRIESEFLKNIQIYISIVNNLNGMSLKINNKSGRKRKFIEDDDIIGDFQIPQIYSEECFQNELYLSIKRPNDAFKSLLILSNLNIDDINDINVIEEFPFDVKYSNISLYYFTLLHILLIQRNMESLIYNVKHILKLSEDSKLLTVTNDIAWIFKGIGVFQTFNAEESQSWDIIEDIFESKIMVEFAGSDVMKYNILNIPYLIQFMKPQYNKYEQFLTSIVKHTMENNNKAMIHGLVYVVNKWKNSYYDFNKLVQLIFKFFKSENCKILNELMKIYSVMKDIPCESIEIETLIPKLDFVLYTYSTKSLNKLDKLMKHIVYCKSYYTKYGNQHLEDPRMKIFKKMHNSYIIDFCNLFWKDSLPETTQLLLPFEFWSNLKEDEKFNILNNSYTRETPPPSELEIEQRKLYVLEKLKEQSYTGIFDFLVGSIRSVQSAMESM